MTVAEKTETVTYHTPGDWQIAIQGTMTGRYPVIWIRHEDGDPRELASLETSETRDSLARKPRAKWKRLPDADEIEANARLMRASPKLFAACMEAREFLSGVGDVEAFRLTELLDVAIGLANPTSDPIPVSEDAAD